MFGFWKKTTEKIFSKSKIHEGVYPHSDKEKVDSPR